MRCFINKLNGGVNADNQDIEEFGPFHCPLLVASEASEDEYSDRKFSGYDGGDEMGERIGVPCSNAMQRPSESGEVTRIFADLLSSILESGTEFGNHARTYLREKPIAYHGRIRDLFPMPRIICLGKTDMEFPDALVINIANLSIAALSFLHGDRAVSVDRAPTRLQMDVQLHVLSKVEQLFTRLAQSTPGDASLTFGAFVGRGKSTKYPTTDPEQVDGLRKAGLVDPLPFLGKSMRDVVSSAAQMFPDGVNAEISEATFTAGKRADYLTLLVRHLRSGKVALCTNAVAAGSVFVVGKPNGKQREVWHGGRISEAARRPPKPPHLITPTALTHLETSKAEPFYIAKKDGSCFFDQLQLPPDLRKYMGRPPVRLDELLGLDGLTLSELQSYLLTESHHSEKSQLVPVNLTWAMGFSWSSYIAQSVMTGCCLKTGLDIQSLLADHTQVPTEMGEVVAVATDDVMHFSNVGPSIGEQWMEHLDTVFESVGVITNASKDISGTKNATCVGIDMVEGTRLSPHVLKLWNCLMAGKDLFNSPFCSPLELASYCGTTQWFSLLNRWSLSCLDEVYRFNRGDGQASIRRLPLNVLSELMIHISLFPFLESDLCRVWHDQLVASDASPSFGFGVAVATCSKRLVKQVGRCSHDANVHIRCARERTDAREKPRAGRVLRLDIGQSAFKTVLSMKASHIEHSGGMEAHALALGMRWLARRRCSHSKRVVFLVDATAIRSAAMKGRSSAPTLKKALQRCASVALACDWMVHLDYMPSESMPADWPSRGQPRPKAVNRHVHRIRQRDGTFKDRHKLSKLELTLRAENRRQAWLHKWLDEHNFNKTPSTSNPDAFAH